MKSRNIELFYEKGLEEEARVSKETIESIFDFEISLIEKDMKGLFKYDDKLNGFVIQVIKNRNNSIILTSKDIFLYGSSSKEDDWVFGMFTNQKEIIISVARMKNNIKDRYMQRLIHVMVHEFSHFVFGNKPEHFKDFIWKNPKTGHEVDLGKHCMDERCVMSEFIDVEDLDKHIDNKYENYFCERCMRYL